MDDESYAERVLTLLRRLNRGERYRLVNQAHEGGFKLSDDYRAPLGRELELDVSAGCIAAMDYHIDWIASAIAFADRPGEIAVGVSVEDETEVPTVQKADEQVADVRQPYLSLGRPRLRS